MQFGELKAEELAQPSGQPGGNGSYTGTLFCCLSSLRYWPWEWGQWLSSSYPSMFMSGVYWSLVSGDGAGASKSVTGRERRAEQPKCEDTVPLRRANSFPRMLPVVLLWWENGCYKFSCDGKTDATRSSPVMGKCLQQGGERSWASAGKQKSEAGLAAAWNSSLSFFWVLWGLDFLTVFHLLFDLGASREGHYALPRHRGLSIPAGHLKGNFSLDMDYCCTEWLPKEE